MSSKTKISFKSRKDNDTIILVSKEKDSLAITSSHARLSGYMVDCINNNSIMINIPFISTALLEKLVSYLTHHKGISPREIARPIRYPQMKKVTNKWDATFIDDIWDENKQDLYTLTITSKVLRIKPLYDLCCAKIASLIKGKSINKMMRILRE